MEGEPSTNYQYIMTKSKFSKYLLLIILFSSLSFHVVSIDKSQVKQAAQIIGLEINDTEIDSLIGNLENAIAILKD